MMIIARGPAAGQLVRNPKPDSVAQFHKRSIRLRRTCRPVEAGQLRNFCWAGGPLLCCLRPFALFIFQSCSKTQSALSIP
jgi:hypothetical protein